MLVNTFYAFSSTFFRSTIKIMFIYTSSGATTCTPVFVLRFLYFGCACTLANVLDVNRDTLEMIPCHCVPTVTIKEQKAATWRRRENIFPFKSVFGRDQKVQLVQREV